jgi:PLP dependent protein
VTEPTVTAPAALVDRVSQGLAHVRHRIVAAGGDPAAVQVVAVTKGFGPEALAAAKANDALDVGENYAQEAVAKLAALGAGSAGLRLHFIGHLQSNKVKLLAPHVALWQTVDRASIVEAVARHAPGAAVLVQVNVSDEPHKGGCAPTEAAALVDAAVGRGLTVRGLMTVGRTGPPDEAGPGFALLRSLCDRMGLPVCSMGMTDDLHIAVAEGATMVRVGSALFGMRPSTPPPELA